MDGTWDIMGFESHFDLDILSKSKSKQEAVEIEINHSDY